MSMFKKGRILVVDDDDDVRDATRDILERNGFEVVAVSSGSEALAFLTYDTPTLVLLDLHMDDVNGWEVLGALRDNPRFAATKIIVVTGSDAKVSPPTRVLRKPFKLSELMAIIDPHVTAAAS